MKYGTYVIFLFYFFVPMQLKSTVTMQKDSKSSHLFISKPIKIAIERSFYLARLQKVMLVFDMPLIKKYTHEAKPFFLVWNDFRCYRRIDDDSIIQELIDEAYICLQTILKISGQQDKIFYIDNNHDTDFGMLAEKIDAIDVMVGRVHGEKSDFFLKRQGYESIFKDLLAIDPDKIIVRFYHIKRLNKIFNFLKQLHNRRESEILFFEGHYIAFTIETCKKIINHFHISHLLEMVIKTKSVSPIIDMWECIQYYYYIGDELLIKDFLTLLFMLIQNLIINDSFEINQSLFVTMHDSLPIFDVSNNLQDLSIEKLLLYINGLEKRLEVVMSEIHEKKTWYHELLCWLF